MSSTKSTMKSMISRTSWPLLPISLSLLIGCSEGRPIVFVTGLEYIRLEKGQRFEAPRAMTLATESVIQKKNEQIVELLRANKKLSSEILYLRSR